MREIKHISIIVAILLLLLSANIPGMAAQLPALRTYSDAEGNIYWDEATLPYVNDHSVSVFSASPQVIENNLPSRYDTREHGIATSVKSQGISSACWAISATDILEQNLMKKNLPAQDFSEAHLTWFAHRSLIYSSARDAGDGTLLNSPFLHGGNWIDAVATLSRWAGPATEQAFPFDAENISAMGNYDELSRFERNAILTSASCFYSKDNQTAASLSVSQMKAIKQAILTDGAVQMSYFSDGNRYHSTDGITAYYQKNIYTTNHAIVVVGWDDDFSTEHFSSSCRPSANGAWLCKNSWGEAWGDDGYFWISYDEVSLNQIVGYTADSQYAYGENYQYDGFGFHGRVFSNDYIRFVNVFTADEDCEIAAVGTWFLQYGAPYTVDVYTGLAEDFQIPVSAQKASSVSGTVEQYGYRVVNLRTPVAVRKGEIFSVAVTLTVDEDCPTVNAAIENSDADDYVSYSEERQSFVQIQRNGQWFDTSAEGLNNICLKVLTAHEHTTSTIGTVCEECGDAIDFADTPLIRRLLELFWRYFSNLYT